MGHLSACLVVISLLQGIKQAQWPEVNPVLAFPGIVQKDGSLHQYATKSMPELLSISHDRLDHRLPKEVFSLPSAADGQFLRVWESLPRLKVEETQTPSRTLRVRVRRLNRGYTDRNMVYAPKFPKPQQESWFVVASDSGGKLLALQRLTLSGRESSVELDVPKHFTGESVTLRILSDGWRGVNFEKTVAWKSVDVRET